MIVMFPSIDMSLHDAYLAGDNQFETHAKALTWSARSMLDSAKLTSKFPQARSLNKAIEESRKGTLADKIKTVPLRTQLSESLHECFEAIVDDLLILSAFEMFAKSNLLRLGYVVHKIRSPSSTMRIQAKRPVHVRALRDLKSQGMAVEFSSETLSVGPLLGKKSYRDVYQLPENVLLGLEGVRARRNLVHCNLGYAFSISEELLAAVEYLHENLPRRDDRETTQPI